MRTLLTALGLTLAFTGAAMAQPAPSMLNKLHDDLRLTPGQDAAWRVYASGVEDGGQLEARRQAAEQLLPQIPTPRRLALMEATMSQELADFRRQRQAIETFYGHLTPDQQRTFDRETLPQATASADVRGR